MVGRRAGSLDEVRARLERWRERHGGPGTRIPEELWSEAARVAVVAGIGATARALRLNEGRLAKRMVCAERSSSASEEPARSVFVELDPSGVCSSGRTLLVLEREGGERLRIEVTGATTVDVIALMRTFWSRESCSN